MKKGMFVLCLAILIVTISISLIYDSTLFFSGKNFLNGEFWRILTFSFVHINLLHLLKNTLALLAITVLAYELSINEIHLIFCFLLVPLFIALIIGLLYPMLNLVGFSLGIYVLLGYLALRGTIFISPFILIPLLTFPLILENIQNIFSDLFLLQPPLHFLSFFVGMVIYCILPVKKKLRKARSRKKSYRFYRTQNRKV